MDFFRGTQERVRNSRGKRAISVRASEVPLYFNAKTEESQQPVLLSCSGVNTLNRPCVLLLAGPVGNTLLHLQPTPFSRGGLRVGGGSGRAKVLDKRLVLGRPASLDNRRARTYCACSKYG